MKEWDKFRKARVEYLLHLHSRIKARLFTFLVRGQFGSCGRGVVVCPPMRFANLKYFHLGDDVVINRDCWIHVLSNSSQNPEPRLLIGARTGIGMGNTISVAKEVTIGKDVMFARGVYISDHGHAFEDPSIPPASQGIRDIVPVVISDGVWLGQNVCVLPGVTIGKHSVIGANAVVSKSIPDYSVAVGSPARVIKKYSSTSNSWERVG